MPKKWEYLVVKLGLTENKEVQKYLNDCGENGWELVAVTPYVGTEDNCFESRTAYLKKEKG